MTTRLTLPRRSATVAAATLTVVAALAASPTARGGAPPAPQTFYYEPAKSVLSGTVKRVVFPGPPNYEDVKAGDAPQVCWILLLPRKANVRAIAGASTDEFNVPETGISDIQLAFTEPDAYQKHRRLLGKPVTVTGTLFHAHTGHHFTRVLLSVSSLRPAKAARGTR
jgi:hypothetical protein